MNNSNSNSSNNNSSNNNSSNGPNICRDINIATIRHDTNYDYTAKCTTIVTIHCFGRFSATSEGEECEGGGGEKE